MTILCLPKEAQAPVGQPPKTLADAPILLRQFEESLRTRLSVGDFKLIHLPSATCQVVLHRFSNENLVTQVVEAAGFTIIPQQTQHQTR